MSSSSIHWQANGEIVSEEAEQISPENLVEFSPQTVESFEEEFAELRRKILRTLDPAKLSSSYGGVVFAAGSDVTAFDDSILVPFHPERETIEEVLKSLSEKGEHVGLHARRVTFVSSAVSNTLAFGPARDANVRISSLLLNWGLLEGGEELITRDFLCDCPKEILLAVSRGFRKSAELIKEKADDEVAARTVSAIASLVLDEEVSEHQEIVADAKCALLTELVDRSCWKEGEWNPYGAYRALRVLRDETRIYNEPSLSRALGRVLGEAASSRTTLVSSFLPETGGHNQTEVGNLGSDAENHVCCDRHQSIPLPDLLPGMRTARPILSADERVILPADIELDDDLIWRIWQLATMLPLRGSIVITPEFQNRTKR